MATLHVVGDLYGNVGTGALTAFAKQLTGYTLLGGAYGATEGSDVYLTIDADLNEVAYEALNGRKGTVAVYNYETGEILCLVSSPSYDPVNIPDDLESNEAYEGAYVNRFFSATFTPGSVFKTVTLAAAVEEIPDLTERTWVCDGSAEIGGGTVTCAAAHGEQDIRQALANLLQQSLRRAGGGAGGRDHGQICRAGGADRQLLGQWHRHGQGHLRSGRGRGERHRPGLGGGGAVPRQRQPPARSWCTWAPLQTAAGRRCPG